MYLPKQPEKHIGKYRRLRLNYLKVHKRGLYTELLISGTLKQHLIKIDEITNSKVNELIKQLDLLYDDFMRYLTYITEKYYRNGFVDGFQLVMGCFDE